MRWNRERWFRTEECGLALRGRFAATPLISTPPRHASRATPPHERRGEVNIPSCPRRGGCEADGVVGAFPRRGGTQCVTGWCMQWLEHTQIG
jgi:hypothetical protein